MQITPEMYEKIKNTKGEQIGEKLYQTLTAKEIMEQLNLLNKSLKNILKIEPIAIKAAIEYIWLKENK